MSIKNWEKEFVNEFCDPNDTDLINEYEESWRIKNFISNLLTRQRTELLEEYFEKEDNLIDKHANLKDNNWDKFLEARSKLKINLLNKKDE